MTQIKGRSTLVLRFTTKANSLGKTQVFSAIFPMAASNYTPTTILPLDQMFIVSRLLWDLTFSSGLILMGQDFMPAERYYLTSRGRRANIVLALTTSVMSAGVDAR